MAKEQKTLAATAVIIKGAEPVELVRISGMAVEELVRRISETTGLSPEKLARIHAKLGDPELTGIFLEQVDGLSIEEKREILVTAWESQAEDRLKMVNLFRE